MVPRSAAIKAGPVANDKLNGTLCVCSPRTNGQKGECRSCSDQGSSVGSQLTKQTLQVKHIARSSPLELGL